MRAVVSTAVAVIVALHAVLGCCWHHAHETVAATVTAPAKAAESVKANRCCCHRYQSDEPKPVGRDSSQQGSPESCPAPCDKKCDAPAVFRVHLDDVALVPLFAWFATFAQPVLTPAVFTSRADLADEELQPPPIRLHLLHQLLLI